LSSAFVAEFTQRLSRQSPAMHLARTWLEQSLIAQGLYIDQLVHLESQNQAADQVSVGNAVTSMRAVAALDWNAFFERTSAVEAVLRRDPFGTYAATEPETRDRYRHAVERLARRGEGGEVGVARLALALAEQAREQAPADVKRAHVGYYLIDEGMSLLEGLVRYRPTPGERFRRGLLAHPELFYFGSIGLLALGIVALMAGVALGSVAPGASGSLSPSASGCSRSYPRVKSAARSRKRSSRRC